MLIRIVSWLVTKTHLHAMFLVSAESESRVPILSYNLNARVEVSLEQS